jgi:dTDP-4-dehydrorhamnose 3,5-epimerase
MIFTETRLAGAYLIELERHQDERGFFARAWCEREFAERGLDAWLVQCNLSHNRRRGVLRGLHYQAAPHEEVKLVRCTRGSVYDVILDVRPGAVTYGQWQAFELTADNQCMLYIPAGVAHGFQALEDSTDVYYQMSASYHGDSQRGIRWDDPILGIPWPVADRIVSTRDQGFPLFAEHAAAER